MVPCYRTAGSCPMVTMAQKGEVLATMTIENRIILKPHSFVFVSLHADCCIGGIIAAFHQFHQVKIPKPTLEASSGKGGVELLTADSTPNSIAFF
jgi:hypothetical protein